MEAKIVPVEYKVLVKLDPVKEKERVIVIPDNIRDRELARDQSAQTTGTLESVGGMAFSDWKGRSPHVGERVITARYSGLILLDKEGKDTLLRLCNDKDIAAIIEAEND